MANKSEIIEIHRQGVVTKVPKDFYDQCIAEGKYFTLVKQKNTKGFRYDLLVCKKHKEKLVFRQRAARLIIGAPKRLHVDHIDRDPLNNCRSNLRLCSHKENMRNKSKAASAKFKYKGLSQKKAGGPFYSTVICDGIRYSAGPFKTEEEAAKSYDRMATWLFGVFASLNFPKI